MKKKKQQIQTYCLDERHSSSCWRIFLSPYHSSSDTWYDILFSFA